MSHRNGTGNIYNIMLAQHLGGVLSHAAVGSLHLKSRTFFGINQVKSTVIVAFSKSISHCALCHTVLFHDLIVTIDISGATLGQSIKKFHLGAHHIVQAVEGLQVLMSQRSDHTHVRIHDITDFLDVAHMSGTHLAKENLVSCFQGTADSLNYTHGSIVAFGSHEHIKACTQKCMQIIFHAGLAETTCDTDDLQIGASFQHPAGIIDIPAVNTFFHGLIDQIAQKHQIRA